MKLLKVHTPHTNVIKGTTYRVEIHAYNLVMYRSQDVYQNSLRKFRDTTENLGKTLVTKNDFA